MMPPEAAKLLSALRAGTVNEPVFPGSLTEAERIGRVALIEQACESLKAELREALDRHRLDPCRENHRRVNDLFNEVSAIERLRYCATRSHGAVYIADGEWDEDARDDEREEVGA